MTTMKIGDDIENWKIDLQRKLGINLNPYRLEIQDRNI